MNYAFQEGFKKGYKKIVLIGSDLFDLKSKHINEAFQQLTQHEVVIGPAQDGGYYLIGMTAMLANLFKNKSWGTASVFKNTIRNLKNENVFLLETLNDIDTYDDMKNNKILKAFIQQHD